MVVKFLASSHQAHLRLRWFGLVSFACALGAFLWALYYKLAG